MIDSEARLRSIEDRLLVIETKLDTFATKNDLLAMENRLIKEIHAGIYAGRNWLIIAMIGQFAVILGFIYFTVNYLK